MAVAELKTKRNNKSVAKFISEIANTEQRLESEKLLAIFSEISGEVPVMWGDTMVGFGTEKLKYASGRELEWFKIGFSPRKGSFSLYVLRGGAEKYADLLQKIGKHSVGKICLYVKRLSDIDMKVLADLIVKANK